jgi:formate hydrogenlyase subunit 3/multisubunit Na+/H+ antiporter MnhD subunit
VNPVPGPILLLVLPLLAAGATYLVRRWAILAAFLATAMAIVLAFLCLRLPLDRSAFVLGQEVAFGRPIVILGQTLQLDPAGKLWLAFVFGLATIYYLVAWRISQGRSFFPFSLAILTLYTLVILLQVFEAAVLVFAVSVALTVFIIQAGQLTSVRGAQRYLLVTLLALPFLLAAGWLVNPSAPDAQTAEMIRRAVVPAALGLGLLLAVFPFGTWMPAVAADAPPIVTAFLFTAGQAMALFLTFAFFRDNPLVTGDPVMATVIRLAGLVMAASGGLMAAVQRDFGRFFGYAALSSLGILLLALEAGGSQGVTLALLHGVGRSVSIALLAAALAILRHRVGTDRFAELQGIARHLPIATLGLMLGGLALAGFPLTAGFPTYWAVSRALWSWAYSVAPTLGEVASAVEAAPGQGWVSTITMWALIVSSAGIIIGLLRGLNGMLGAERRTDVARQPLAASLIVLALAALTIVLGLCPQLLLDPVQSAAQAFSLF